MFFSGAKVDLNKIEEEIRKEIEEKKKLFFTDYELEGLHKLELRLIPREDVVWPHFHKDLTFEKPDLRFWETDYNVNLDTFLYSATSKFLMKMRNWLRPFFRLHGNVDAVIHKQALFNQQQADFNTAISRSLERPFHYIRVLHTLVNYLVSELTRLSLQHQKLRSQVEALAYDLEQLKKRERLLERISVLKEEQS